jgi:hypothetical protein
VLPQVLATDPFSLFSYSGAQRLDAVVEAGTGRVDIAAYILSQEAGQDVDVRCGRPGLGRWQRGFQFEYDK